jgi:hypothetical protein
VENVRSDDPTTTGKAQSAGDADDAARRTSAASPEIESAADEWRASAELFGRRASTESDSSLWIG